MSVLHTQRLVTALQDASVPVISVSTSNGVASVVYSASATSAQKTTGASIISAFDWSAAADAAAVLSRARADALLSKIEPLSIAQRAVLLTLLDELNLHALKINSILDAADNAGTFAAFKTAVAAIADYPQRTAAQLKTAIASKVNAGSADT